MKGSVPTVSGWCPELVLHVRSPLSIQPPTITRTVFVIYIFFFLHSGKYYPRFAELHCILLSFNDPLSLSSAVLFCCHRDGRSARIACRSFPLFLYFICDVPCMAPI